MEEILRNFKEQFLFDPIIENLENFKEKNKFLIVGMGGSILAGGLLKILKEDLDIILHSNFGLPKLNDLNERKIIFVSHSGNTEETLDSFEVSFKNNFDCFVISSDGALLKRAIDLKIPYIKIPNSKIPPRLALVYIFKSLLKVINDENGLKEISLLKNYFDTEKIEKEGRELAEKIKGYIPIIYSSNKNFYLAYNFKIRFNETSKIPSFCNTFPELSHNEIEGLNEDLSKSFFFIFLKDKDDDVRILKRIEICKKILEDKKFKVEVINFEDKNIYYKIFSLINLADWTSYYLAKIYKKDPIKTEIIEKIKKLSKD
ncbi:MAG: bifunctional phosphoglucose/phosphomannose isomerase [Minisyncoccia bacterium]